MQSLVERSVKLSVVQILMNVRPDGRAVSFFGDLHPSFAGNVVRAMGSAKQDYPFHAQCRQMQRARRRSEKKNSA